MYVCAGRRRRWRGLWLCRSSHKMICCMRKAICLVVVVSSRARLLNGFKFDFDQLWSEKIGMSKLLNADCQYLSLDEKAIATVEIVEFWVPCHLLLEYTHFSRQNEFRTCSCREEANVFEFESSIGDVLNDREENWVLLRFSLFVALALDRRSNVNQSMFDSIRSVNKEKKEIDWRETDFVFLRDVRHCFRVVDKHNVCIEMTFEYEASGRD